MLRRQPESRASLDDIVNDSWLGGAADDEGNAISSDDQLPMVSREHLTEEEHAYILKKMVGGGIADRDEIIEALDLNEYNHVTATYFLLAERLLSAQRDAMARRLRQRTRQVVRRRAVTSDAVVTVGSPSRRGVTDEAGDLAGVAEMGKKPSVTVDSLLSPEATAAAMSMAAAATTSSSGVGTKFGGGFRSIAIVEEEEEEEEEEDEIDISRSAPIPVPTVLQDDDDVMTSAMSPGGQPRLSRHSSASSLADKSAEIAAIDIATIAAGLKGIHEGHAGSTHGSGTSTPAPFPVTSHIGTGGLSRQGSLRRVGGEGLAAAAAVASPAPAAIAASAPALSSSPASERRASASLPRQSSSSPSPSTPPGSTGSSVQSSPARYIKVLSNKKLVSTRSSPQLILNQVLFIRLF